MAWTVAGILRRAPETALRLTSPDLRHGRGGTPPHYDDTNILTPPNSPHEIVSKRSGYVLNKFSQIKNQTSGRAGLIFTGG